MKKILMLMVVMMVGLVANAQANQAAKSVLMRGIERADSLVHKVGNKTVEAVDAAHEGLEKGKVKADTLAVRGGKLKDDVKEGMKDMGERMKLRGNKIKDGAKEVGNEVKNDLDTLKQRMGARRRVDK